jgi:MoxR-like ATPase
MIANSFSIALGMQLSASNFTPDLLPGILPADMCFESDKTALCCAKVPSLPIFCWPMKSTGFAKTQSALLEAMQEYQVTLEGETQTLPDPFIVSPLSIRSNMKHLPIA